jgi:hypothetical protein
MATAVKVWLLSSSRLSALGGKVEVWGLLLLARGSLAKANRKISKWYVTSLRTFCTESTDGELPPQEADESEALSFARPQEATKDRHKKPINAELKLCIGRALAVLFPPLFLNTPSKRYIICLFGLKTLWN